jgi:hypothetical protein
MERIKEWRLIKSMSFDMEEIKREISNHYRTEPASVSLAYVGNRTWTVALDGKKLETVAVFKKGSRVRFSIIETELHHLPLQ